MLDRLRVAGKRVRRADHRYMRRSARAPRTVADPLLKRLSMLADHSKLWFVIAGTLAVRKGAPHRAALRGIAAIAGTSALTNSLAKPLLPRRRPPNGLLPEHRRLTDPPRSSSFPSGHAASATAFATAVFMETPTAGLVIAPIAAAVAYSRIHTGVHWPSDVVVGASIGMGVGFATRRWWPVRPATPGVARTSAHVTELTDGRGLVVVVNPSSGDAADDPETHLAEIWPAATLVRTAPGDIAGALDRALDTEGEQVRAVGVAGGDGSVAAVAEVAAVRGLPLVVVPSGTLNHFARDVGVSYIDEAARAVATGSAVNVDLGTVRVDDHPQHWFVNTASLGGYPDMVRFREKWENRWGKWPSAAVALINVLAHAEPISVRIDGLSREVWLVFVGNSGYQPKGFAPSWRPRLDDGVLDIRYVRADLPLSRVRFTIAALTGALFNSRTYVQEQRDSLRIDVLGAPVSLACDGEIRAEGQVFQFTARDEALRVYRPAGS